MQVLVHVLTLHLHASTWEDLVPFWLRIEDETTPICYEGFEAGRAEINLYAICEICKIQHETRQTLHLKYR